MSQQLCIVPRWGGTSVSEWYPWLCEQTEVRQRFDSIVRPDIEVPGTPTIDAWVASLTAACGSGRDTASAEDLARTVFIGHSVGCQAVLRYLGSLPAGVTTAGCLLVAGWWTVDEPWETLLPWSYPPEVAEAAAGANAVPELDLDHVRAASGRFVVLISDNDPFTSDWQATKAAWQERLGATVRVIPGAKHFNATEAPTVLEALLELSEEASGESSH